MASTDCTLFAVKSQAYRVYVFLGDSTTGNPLATMGTLTTIMSQDGTYNATSPTPVAVSASQPGLCYVDLTAAQMGYNCVCLTVKSDTANAQYGRIVIVNADLSEPTGHWLTQTIQKLEQGIVQVGGYLFNKVKRNTNTGTVTMYKLDETTAVGTMARSTPTEEIVKGELT